MRLQFGGWIFDGETRELLRGAEPVHLSPKAFELLGALLEVRPRALSKAEIQDRLWPATFVSESNLAGLVREIRRVTGDAARSPRLVRTVHGFGYAFCGAVADASLERPGAGAVQFRLVWGPRSLVLGPGENVLGRGTDAGVWIDSTTVSRHHARIVVTGRGATIEDLGSKNGTHLRGRRVTGPTRLENGDEIVLGSVRLSFRVLTEEESTDTHGG